LSDADTRFFDRLLALERGVYGAPADAQGAHHIVLGTFRREAYDPATWLGDDRYAGLAGDMGIPSAEPWRAVSWIGGSEVTRRGYSLAARLAFPDGTQGDRDGWSWLRTPEDLFVAEGRADVAATPVDLITLSKITVLDPLEPDRAAVSLRDLAKAGRFSKQIVLFGIVAQRADGTYLDGHLVPGFGDQPGVKIHAAAAYSLRSARLYDLTWLCKTVLDVLCFAVLIGFVGFVRWHYAGSTRAVDAHRFTRIVGVLLAIVLVGTAMLLFGAVRVMWDDALLVAAFVAAHPFMERFYAGAATKTRRSCASLWNWALSGSNEG
jgi:hypothetical protein